MTPRRPGSGDGAPDLMGVKATDTLFEQLSRGEFAPAEAGAATTGSSADDQVTRSLSALAAYAQTPPAAVPSLEELLVAAGLVLRPATPDEPGGLDRVGHPDLSVLDGLDGRSGAVAAGASSSTWLGLNGRLPWLDRAGQHVALAAGVVSEQAGRGLRRIGVDTERVPRISPMVAAAAAVVAFGLTGVATGMLGADPLTVVGATGLQQSGTEDDARLAADLIDKARVAAADGRGADAQRYYYQASVLVHRLPAAPVRDRLSKQVEDLRVNLGISETEGSQAGDGRTPATPPATTVASIPTVVIVVPTLPKAATPPPSISSSTTQAPSATTSTTTTEPTTTTSAPTPTPTPSPTSTPTSTPTISVGDLDPGTVAGADSSKSSSSSSVSVAGNSSAGISVSPTGAAQADTAVAGAAAAATD